MRRALLPVLALALAACGTDLEREAFGFTGEVRDSPPPGSVVSLWLVGTGPEYLYKFGIGSSVVNQFDMSYPGDPPTDAVNTDGIGIAMMGLLRGIATLPDGMTTQDLLRLEGVSPEHAVVWKGPGATGPAWAAGFAEGFTCARCVRDAAGLDTLAPIDCSFILIRANTANQCVYY